MTQKARAALLLQAAEIRDETVSKANTAVRVGTMSVDQIDSFLNIEDDVNLYDQSQGVNDNAIDIGNLQIRATANEALIADNTDNIAVNASNISDNDDNIAINASNIATNAGNISTNSDSIAAQAMDIAANTNSIIDNDADIAANTAAINTNTTDIASNAANIAGNDSDIIDLQSNKIDKTQGLVETNDFPANSARNYEVLTQAEYDGIGAVDANTLYFIV